MCVSEVCCSVGAAGLIYFWAKTEDQKLSMFPSSDSHIRLLMSSPAMSTPAKPVRHCPLRHSCNVHPCNSVCLCPVMQCPPLPHRPFLSSPAMSSPAISAYPSGGLVLLCSKLENKQKLNKFVIRTSWQRKPVYVYISGSKNFFWIFNAHKMQL